jgi:uncharacterized protein involved in type VI secretion and phage assembly
MTTELLRCIVTGFEDPEGQCRIRVRPLEDTDGDGEDDGPTPDETAFWVRVVAPGAGKFTGLALTPALGDEVLVTRSSPDGEAYLLGGLWSVRNPAPVAFSEDAPPLALETRHGTRIVVDGATPGIELATASGLRVLVDDTNGRVVIADGNGNEMAMSSEGISLASKREMSLRSEAGTTLSAISLRLHSHSTLELRAATVKIEGTVIVNGRLLR